MQTAIFLIEGGQALEMVRKHISDRHRVLEQSRDLVRELGVECVRVSNSDGSVLAVNFEGHPVHPDFTKPSKHGSRPKKGTEWEKRFDAQVGYENPDKLIGDAFNIPGVINYGKDGSLGSRLVGYPFSPCEFLYLSKEGPYAMCVPDIEAEVKADEGRGYEVAEPAKSFRMEFDGCRRLEQEEWDILVAQHDLAEKRANKLAA